MLGSARCAWLCSGQVDLSEPPLTCERSSDIPTLPHVEDGTGGTPCVEVWRERCVRGRRFPRGTPQRDKRDSFCCFDKKDESAIVTTNKLKGIKNISILNLSLAV